MSCSKVGSIAAGSERSEASSRRLKRSGSPITPYLITSAMPARNSLTGSVFNVKGSITTKRGWWKAPIRFFPFGWFTPVLPPMEASTIERRVVGTWTMPMPRSQQAAAKPVMSPTTPPPSASIREVRSRPSCCALSRIKLSVCRVFRSSPASISSSTGLKPAALSPLRQLSPYGLATSGLLTTRILVPDRMGRSASAEPMSSTIERPMITS